MSDTSPDPTPLPSGHGAPCYYCGEPCNSFAGNGTLWPVALCHADDPGRAKWHHTGCVSSRLEELTTLRASLGEAEKRAEEAERRHADKDAAYLRAMAREVSADDRTATVLEKLNEVVAEKRASEGLVAVLRDGLIAIQDCYCIDGDSAAALARVHEIAETALSTTPSTRTLGRTPVSPGDRRSNVYPERCLDHERRKMPSDLLGEHHPHKRVKDKWPAREHRRFGDPEPTPGRFDKPLDFDSAMQHWFAREELREAGHVFCDVCPITRPAAAGEGT